MLSSTDQKGYILTDVIDTNYGSPVITTRSPKTVGPLTTILTTVTPSLSRPKPSTAMELFKQTTPRTVLQSHFSHRPGTFTSGTATTAPGSGGWRKTEVKRVSELYSFPAFSPMTADVSGLDNRLASKIKATTASVLQDMAEFRQTRDLVADTAVDVVKFFHRLRSGRAFSEFVRILQQPRGHVELQIANRWLEYQMGWRPLISSIHDTTETLISDLREGVLRSARASVKLDYGLDTLNSSPPDSYFVRYSRYGDGYYTRRAVWRVRDSSLKRLSDLGFTNPANLVWELIPYSFVVDYLLGVGRYLSVLDWFVGVEDLTLADSRYARVSEIVTLSGGYDPDPLNYYSNWLVPASVTRKTTYSERFGAQVRSLDIRYIPPGKMTNAGNRLLNSLSLLTQLKVRF